MSTSRSGSDFCSTRWVRSGCIVLKDQVQDHSLIPVVAELADSLNAKDLFAVSDVGMVSAENLDALDDTGRPTHWAGKQLKLAANAAEPDISQEATL